MINLTQRSSEGASVSLYGGVDIDLVSSPDSLYVQPFVPGTASMSGIASYVPPDVTSLKLVSCATPGVGVYIGASIVYKHINTTLGNYQGGTVSFLLDPETVITSNASTVFTGSTKLDGLFLVFYTDYMNACNSYWTPGITALTGGDNALQCDGTADQYAVPINTSSPVDLCKYDLGSVLTLHNLNVCVYLSSASSVSSTIALATSPDNSAWTNVASYAASSSEARLIQAEEATARYIKVTATNLSSSGALSVVLRNLVGWALRS